MFWVAPNVEEAEEAREANEMKRTEITGDIQLDPPQLRLVGYHSFVNIINVLVIELERLEGELEKPDLFRSARQQLLDLIDAFREEEAQLPLMQHLNEMRLLLQANLEEHAPEATQIMKILEVAHMRIEEMIARQSQGDCWVRMSFARLRHSFELVFTVISELARDRYRITFREETPRTKPPRDEAVPVYRIILELASPDGETIHMPLVLQDVLRDLTANARKYTEPGGRIVARLEETARELILTVRDNGRGIHPEEIPRVVRFGERGSNTAPSETRGGGFGLTKAHLVTRTLGGRMWITSATEGPEGGTTVEIRVPQPPLPGQ
ncbi:MAG: sensor histidine kinase [Spirochaetaceae bacterium]|nr:MAG: sensor histidine kinase [Spirochaetaceae bacterium]